MSSCQLYLEFIECVVVLSYSVFSVFECYVDTCESVIVHSYHRATTVTTELQLLDFMRGSCWKYIK